MPILVVPNKNERQLYQLALRLATENSRLRAAIAAAATIIRDKGYSEDAFDELVRIAEKLTPGDNTHPASLRATTKKG